MEKPDKTPDLMRWMMRAAVALVLAAVLMGGCNYWNAKLNLDNDHPLEQAAEALIEHHTGLDLDLSPEE